MFKHIFTINFCYKQLASTTSNLQKAIKNKKTLPYNYYNSIRYKTYLPNNEWITEDDGVYKIGIDKEGAEKMGELVYIDYNSNPSDSVQQDEDIVFLESVKAVESIKAPFSCTIIENNDLLVDNPSKINENSECEETSWIVKFKRN